MNFLLNKFWTEEFCEYHIKPEQIKRQKNALSEKYIPISLDIDNKLTKFKGSEDIIYETTLECCTCIDFARRKLPCKHMYRLASELKIFQLPNIELSETLDFMNFKEAKKIIDRLSFEAKTYLYEFIRTKGGGDLVILKNEKCSIINELIENKIFIEKYNSEIIFKQIFYTKKEILKNIDIVNLLKEKGIKGISKLSYDNLINSIKLSCPKYLENLTSNYSLITLIPDFINLNFSINRYLIKELGLSQGRANSEICITLSLDNKKFSITMDEK